MNYKVETLPDSPVLVATMGNTFDVKRDLNPLMDEVKSALDAAPQPMYVIDDVRELASFGDMVTALGTISKGTSLVSTLTSARLFCYDQRYGPARRTAPRQTSTARG
jgi:hypothetical protein